MNRRRDRVGHAGIKESDTGLAPPSMWDLAADQRMGKDDQALQVAKVTKIMDAGTPDAKYMINITQVGGGSQSSELHSLTPVVADGKVCCRPG